MSELISIAELMAVCAEAAERACSRIRSIHATGILRPIEKGDGKDALTGRPMADTQTEADRQSERIIFSAIRRQFPDLCIIGEEESSSFSPTYDVDILASPKASSVANKVLANLHPQISSVPVSELLVFVDPLDGTNEFVSGRLHCVSVLIGIARKGERLGGIIARPFPDAQICASELMYGLVDCGVFIDHVRIAPSLEIRNPVKITTTLKRNCRVTARIFELLAPCDILKEGGAGWKFWLVASGQVDCYQYARPGTKKWDVLAGDAIVSTLGGAVTDACGRKFIYAKDPESFGNDWGILASLNRKFHYATLVPICHKGLSEPSTEWPSGLEIPPLTIDSSL
jgi:3'-phosphoadenosine 5'-phosphosulfate (PAPS) 3'-phosphatase